MPDSLDAVTVLMPVYNAEVYLREAIDSILNQTYSDFEFLIIDDGSSDDSALIIKSYTDKRIRFVQNEKNLGLVETLNKGIALANTELIARMDADDISYPERLQKQVAFFQKNPECTLLATWAQILDIDNKPILIESPIPKYYRYNLTFECWIYHPTVMYKRHVVKDVGMYVSKYSEDFDLWWRITRKYQFDVLPEILLDYRTTESSFSRVVNKTEYEETHIRLMIRNINFYTNKSIDLEEHEVQFLKTNLEPVLKKNKASLIQCFRKLDYITGCIKEKEPFNKRLIDESAFYKKKRILFILKKHLKEWEIVQLLLNLKYWSLLTLYIKQLIYVKLPKF